MRKFTVRVLLGIVFLATLFIRLWYVFQTDALSGDAAYFHLGQVEHIVRTGLPDFTDPSGAGARLLFSPVFDYLMAPFALVFGSLVAVKVVPNVFASLLVIAVYFIAKRLTRQWSASLFTAMLAGFIPAFVDQTLNSVSPYSVVIPVVAWLFDAWLRLPDSRAAKEYVFGFIFLSFLHPSVLIVVFGSVLYVLLLFADGLAPRRAELELVLFSACFALWSHLVLYKDAFAALGLGIFSQNVPRQLMLDYFTRVTVLESVGGLGVMTLAGGVYVLYKYVMGDCPREMYVFLGVVLGSGALLWAKLITPGAGLSFLSVSLVLLFAVAFKRFVRFLRGSQAARYVWLTVVLLVLVLFLTNVVPSLRASADVVSRSDAEVDRVALEWISFNTPQDAVVFALPDDAYAVSALAHRRPTLMPDFLLVGDADSRYADVRSVFTSPYITDVVERAERYGASFVYLSPAAQRDFDIDSLPASEGGDCLREVFRNNAVVYEVRCRVRSV